MTTVMREWGRSVVDLDANGNAYLIVKLSEEAIVAEVMRGTGRVMMDFDPATGFAYPIVKMIGGGLGAMASSVSIREDFLGGSISNGQIGTYGWTKSSNGTLTYRDGEANAPGLVRIDTTSVSGTLVTLQLYNTTAAFIAASWDASFRLRLDTVDANTTARLGMMNAATADPPSSGVYFEKLDADTNWFAVSRAATVQTGTRTDTGIAVTTALTVFRTVRVDSTSIAFYIGGVLVATHSANIPSVATTPGVQIINSTGSAKTMTLDYFTFDRTVER